MQNPRYLIRLGSIPQLAPAQQETLQPVSEKFVFRTNEYYQSLIDWSDPADPIRRIIIPDTGELEEWGRLDASDEHTYTVVPGCEHKYADTALLLVNDVCGGYCRFCFRKRLFLDDNDEVVRDVSQALHYIAAHEEISNVLLTGGDPLLMSTRKLENIIASVRQIEHVNIIRIGSKIPAFNPHRILNDPTLPEMISRYSTGQKRIYIMAHFNHPRELTETAVQGLRALLDAGAMIVNQTPLIRGVNDRPEILAELFDRFAFLGIPPYYVFQCRPTLGNKPFSVPVEEAYTTFLQAQGVACGLARRARFCMSHSSGKIEVIGLTEESVIMRYHRAANPSEHGRVMIFPRDPRAHWFDDYIMDEAEHGMVPEPAMAVRAATSRCALG
jgi:KamA family protein